MATKTTSFALTSEERAAIQLIANERFNGSVASTIRAALVAHYPNLSSVPKIGRPGRREGYKVKK